MPGWKRRSGRAASGCSAGRASALSRDEKLVRLFPEEVEIARSFWLVTHPEMAKLARIIAVSEMLRERAEALLGRDAPTD